MQTEEMVHSSELVTLAHALSDPTRLQLLEQLRDRERCVCELTGPLKASQSRLSFHLKALRDAGLVRGRREGRWIHYGLEAGALEKLADYCRGLATAEPGPVACEPSCCC